MNYINQDKSIEDFVRQTFDRSPSHQYPYHNLTHTVEVVRHAQDIARHYEGKGADPLPRPPGSTTSGICPAL
ncbi:MAG TPA: hypothetical protein VIM64_02630 [Puia sp.]